MTHPQTRMQRASRVYLDRRNARAKLQYAEQETPYGNETVQADHELTLFNERNPDITPEMEAAKWAEADAMKMPEDMAASYVGMYLYPTRARLASSGPRALDMYEQARYVDRMARRTGWQPMDEQMPPTGADGGEYGG